MIAHICYSKLHTLQLFQEQSELELIINILIV